MSSLRQPRSGNAGAARPGRTFSRSPLNRGRRSPQPRPPRLRRRRDRGRGGRLGPGVHENSAGRASEPARETRGRTSSLPAPPPVRARRAPAQARRSPLKREKITVKSASRPMTIFPVSRWGRAHRRRAAIHKRLGETFYRTKVYPLSPVCLAPIFTDYTTHERRLESRRSFISAKERPGSRCIRQAVVRLPSAGV